MGKSKNKARTALLKLFKSAFPDLVKCEEVDVKAAYRLPEKKVKIRITDYPMEIRLHPDDRGPSSHAVPGLRK